MRFPFPSCMIHLELIHSHLSINQSVDSVYLQVIYQYTLTELQIRCVKLTSINSTYVISSPNPMVDHLLESTSYRNTDLYRNTHEYRGITEIQLKINDNEENTVFDTFILLYRHLRVRMRKSCIYSQQFGCYCVLKFDTKSSLP